MDFKTHKDIISLWPTITAFGRDIGVSQDTAGQMSKRNNIAPDHWFAVIDAAERRGFSGITLELLLCLRVKRNQSRTKRETSVVKEAPVRELAS